MPTVNDLKNQEKRWRRAFDKVAVMRESDKRDAYLTPDMLRKRQKLTKNGRQKLVLAVGYKGETKAYSLTQLNDMAKQIDRSEGRFQADRGGILVADVLNHSVPDDLQRAKGIGAATLYKFTENMLSFRVQASGDTLNAPSHYQVRVRLEDWGRAVRKGEGGKYLLAAKQATTGRVSFDCNCGRYIYWFHYLASIGGFDIEPHEDVFPKIRNPRLKGCACKHVLKTMLVMNSMAVQMKISAVMEDTAKKHGFSEAGRGKYLSEKDIKKLNVVGSSEASGRAFKKFTANVSAFTEKLKSPSAKRIKKEYEVKMINKLKAKAQEVKQAQGAAQKLAVARLRDLATMSKAYSVPFEKLAADSAKTNPGMGTAEELIAMAKEEGLI